MALVAIYLQAIIHYASIQPFFDPDVLVLWLADGATATGPLRGLIGSARRQFDRAFGGMTVPSPRSAVIWPLYTFPNDRPDR